MPKGDFTFYSHDPIDAPQGYDPRDPSKSFGVQNWNIEGRILPSTVKPLPTLKNPGRYWIQDEDNEWHQVDPRDYDEEPRLSQILGDAYQELKRRDPNTTVREGELVMPPGGMLVDPRTGERVDR